MITTTAELTECQRAVLDHIRDEYRRIGLSPSFREIMLHFGYSSPNAVATHTRKLVAKGLLRLVGGERSGRYVPVVPEGCCPCCGRPMEES